MTAVRPPGMNRQTLAALIAVDAAGRGQSLAVDAARLRLAAGRTR